MEELQSMRATMAQSARIDRALSALQAQVKQCENTLRLLQNSVDPLRSGPLADSTARLKQLNSLKVAYGRLFREEPSLPHHESPIPSLLAFRKTSTCVKETQICVAKSQAERREIQQRLERERSALDGAELTRSTLNNRIALLRAKRSERSRKLPAAMAVGILRAVTRHREYCDFQTATLIKAFNGFIDESVAIMLAVEELGGKIVGEQPEGTEEVSLVPDVSSGQTVTTSSRISHTKTLQLRVDEMWGSGPVLDRQSEGLSSQKRAAGAGMRKLTEKLLNSLVEKEGMDGVFLSAYVDLKEESAAARFLVRSNVAHFHPANARKLRLYNFVNNFT